MQRCKFVLAISISEFNKSSDKLRASVIWALLAVPRTRHRLREESIRSNEVEKRDNIVNSDSSHLLVPWAYTFTIANENPYFKWWMARCWNRLLIFRMYLGPLGVTLHVLLLMQENFSHVCRVEIKPRITSPLHLQSCLFITHVQIYWHKIVWLTTSHSLKL